MGQIRGRTADSGVFFDTLRGEMQGCTHRVEMPNAHREAKLGMECGLKVMAGARGIGLTGMDQPRTNFGADFRGMSMTMVVKGCLTFRMKAPPKKIGGGTFDREAGAGGGFVPRKASKHPKEKLLFGQTALVTVNGILRVRSSTRILAACRFHV